MSLYKWRSALRSRHKVFLHIAHVILGHFHLSPMTVLCHNVVLAKYLQVRRKHFSWQNETQICIHLYYTIKVTPLKSFVYFFCTTSHYSSYLIQFHVLIPFFFLYKFKYFSFAYCREKNRSIFTSLQSLFHLCVLFFFYSPLFPFDVILFT